MENNLYLMRVKEDLHELVDFMNFENIVDIRKDFLLFINVLTTISKVDLGIYDKQNILESLKPDMNLEETNVTSSKIGYDYEEIYDKENNLFIGRVTKCLSGGNIGSFRIYIPEKNMRIEGIEEGDLVKAVTTGYSENSNKPLYKYTLLEKTGEKIENDIFVEKYASISYDENLNEYTLNIKNVDGYSELPYKVILEEKNIGNIQIEEGSIVDFSYYRGQADSGRIIWIYETELEELNLVKKKKIKSRIIDEDEYEQINEPLLDGKVICACCYENEKNRVLEVVEKFGGECKFLTGGEHDDAIISNIENADLVVIYVDRVSHDSMHRAKEVCKKLGKQMVFTKARGRSSLINLILEKISKDDI